MRVVPLVVLLLSLIASSVTLAQDAYVAGRDYIVLDKPVATDDPSKVEVAEVFRYGCGACYSFESLLKDWKVKKLDYVNFVEVPASFDDNQEIHARIYHTALAMKQLDKMHAVIFDALHKDRKKLVDQDEIRELFVDNGIDGKKFDKYFNNYGIINKVKQSKARVTAYRVTGTPQIVVDGRYLVTTERGGFQGMMSVVEFLVDKIHRERQPQS